MPMSSITSKCLQSTAPTQPPRWRQPGGLRTGLILRPGGLHYSRGIPRGIYSCCQKRQYAARRGRRTKEAFQPRIDSRALSAASNSDWNAPALRAGQVLPLDAGQEHGTARRNGVRRSHECDRLMSAAKQPSVGKKTLRDHCTRILREGLASQNLGKQKLF